MNLGFIKATMQHFVTHSIKISQTEYAAVRKQLTICHAQPVLWKERSVNPPQTADTTCQIISSTHDYYMIVSTTISLLV